MSGPVERPVVLPPFRMLDPGLALAERLLTSRRDPLFAVVSALPDERLAAARLNALLWAEGARPRFAGSPYPRLDFVDSRGRPGEAVVAACALAELAVAAGWQRLKTCTTCGVPIVDRTNGCSRRWCDRHRRPSRAGGVPAG